MDDDSLYLAADLRLHKKRVDAVAVVAGIGNLALNRHGDGDLGELAPVAGAQERDGLYFADGFTPAQAERVDP